MGAEETDGVGGISGGEAYLQLEASDLVRK